MVGSIVLPIMMTAGVPRTIAATTFLMGFALGFIFNIANWTFYTKYFGVDAEQLMRYAIVLAVLDALALLIYAAVVLPARARLCDVGGRGAAGSSAPRVPAVALFTPVLPLLLYYAFRFDAAPAFIVAAVFGVRRHAPGPGRAAARRRGHSRRRRRRAGRAALHGHRHAARRDATAAVRRGAATARRGRLAAQSDRVRRALRRRRARSCSIAGRSIRSASGSRSSRCCLTAHVLPPVVLVAAIMAVVQVQNVCDPTNTANVWIANFTGVPIDMITKRTLPYQTAVAIAATLARRVGLARALWRARFASPLRRASAHEALPGFYAPPHRRAASSRSTTTDRRSGAPPPTRRRRARRRPAGIRCACTRIPTRAIARTSVTRHTCWVAASTFRADRRRRR